MLSKTLGRFSNNNFRNFSTYFHNRKTFSKIGLILSGVGLCGLTYICYKEEKFNSNSLKSLSEEVQTNPRKIIHKRIKDTLLYFSSGIAITSLASSVILNSPFLLGVSYNGFAQMINVPLGCMCIRELMRTQSLDYKKNKSLYRNILFVLLNTTAAFSISPYLNYVKNINLIRQTLLVTCGCFGGLGIYTHFSRSDSHLKLGGVLGGAFGALSALGASATFFNSPLIYNYWLYGGLATFLGYTLYDMKNIKLLARKSYVYDPILNSLNIYTDFVNVFLRVAGVLEDQSIKEEEEEEEV